MRAPKTIQEAVAYIADCNLATVSHMAMLKRRPKGEYQRQIRIAQTICDWMEHFGVSPKDTRVEDIIGKQTVAEWAEQYERHT